MFGALATVGIPTAKKFRVRNSKSEIPYCASAFYAVSLPQIPSSIQDKLSENRKPAVAKTEQSLLFQRPN